MRTILKKKIGITEKDVNKIKKTPFYWHITHKFINLFVIKRRNTTVSAENHKKEQNIMSKKIASQSIMALGVVGTALTISLSGCHPKTTKQLAQDTLSIKLDTTIYAIPEEAKSPHCDVKMQLVFINNEKDSAAINVNQAIRRTAFGPQYEKLSNRQFADSLAAFYAAGYNSDIKKLLNADLKNGMSAEEVPGWYNYEYDLSSTLALGMNDKIWNYSLTDFQYTGGAHPNTMNTLINIVAGTGRVLTKKDVFTAEAEKAILPLVIDELVKEAKVRFETDTITCLDGLHEVGVFDFSDPFLPENFLLGKDKVTFYYNRYEIAGYAAGPFEVTLPLEKIKQYIKE